MVERRAVQGQDVGVAPLMIRMAMIAILNACETILAMKANMVRTVLRNLLMAIEAEFRL